MPTSEDTRIVSVRISPRDLVAIRGAALAEGKAVSAYLREAAIERALEPSPSPCTEDS
jgi:uncharacterized protein (DUF1778 family)